ncbi:MAG: hypothetical protein FJY54_00130 [Betaproteobacteria bacterium]|nr:hypothetical protein [Betaproteobacteria bacterium]
MNRMRLATGFGAAWTALVLLAHPGTALASARFGQVEPAPGLALHAEAEYTRFIRMTSSARFVALASKPATANTRAADAGQRGDRPVAAVTATGAGQAGYVHFFVIRGPDGVSEVQVGIELPDQRIAWSFPELGAVVSPFIETGVLPAGGKQYEIWHLYGIRPFPDDAAMTALAGALVERIRPWVEARTPYCLVDGARGNCMSCLGFVLRALFPPNRGSNYPGLPRDFWRAGTASKYTTHDLLLYLTGMLDLPNREARLQRISRLALPEDLREDLEALVHVMGAFEQAPAARAGAPQTAPQLRPATPPSTIGTRPQQRRPL